ncbi:MAG: hypothetical protein QOE12_649, partial [Mycobacterium sp.]|nr:hypothetical protein [Mycobacterium sp.]
QAAPFSLNVIQFTTGSRFADTVERGAPKLKHARRRTLVQ